MYASLPLNMSSALDISFVIDKNITITNKRGDTYEGFIYSILYWRLSLINAQNSFNKLDQLVFEEDDIVLQHYLSYILVSRHILSVLLVLWFICNKYIMR